MKAQPNPWKTKSSQVVYENPWISVREDQVVNPSGNDGIYGVVTMKGFAIGIIPLDEDMNTWLVGQYRYALNLYSWEIPMGGGPRNLSMLESAKRELKEETGLIATEWEEIIRIHTSNSVTDELGVAYVAKGLTQGETEFDDTEDLTIKKIPFKEVFEMTMNGEITDSLSVAAILKLGRTLKL